METIRKQIIHGGEDYKSEDPRIIRLVGNLTEVGAQMLDGYERIVIMGGTNNPEIIEFVSRKINGLKDGEDQYIVTVKETKKGAFYFDCRRVA